MRASCRLLRWRLVARSRLEGASQAAEERTQRTVLGREDPEPESFRPIIRSAFRPTAPKWWAKWWGAGATIVWLSSGRRDSPRRQPWQGEFALVRSVRSHPSKCSTVQAGACQWCEVVGSDHGALLVRSVRGYTRDQRWTARAAVRGEDARLSARGKLGTGFPEVAASENEDGDDR